MSFSFEVQNPGKLIKSLERKNSKFRRLVVKNYTLAADRFIEDIRAKYYSGQQGDVGVNKISGDLRKRWLPVIVDEGKDVVATVSNEMNYAVIHEFGSNIHAKKTFVTEELMGGSGYETFVDAAKKALKEAF
jgi:phage gpG-like protein